MEGIKTSAFAIFSFALLVIMFIFMASASKDVMTVEANIFAGSGTNNDSTIRIEVPDYLFFGNVSVGDISDELKVYINNTGSVDVTVTPKLLNRSEEIFSYLNFRKFKTSNGTSVPFTRIGDFSFNINKPSGGNTYEDEYIYMALDLRNYTGVLNQNLIGHKADVKFFAVER